MQEVPLSTLYTFLPINHHKSGCFWFCLLTCFWNLGPEFTRILQNPPNTLWGGTWKKVFSRGVWGVPKTYSQADRIHGPCLVYSFYLHLVDFYGFHVGKYTSPMDPTVDGSEILLTTKHVGKGNCCKEWDIYHINGRRISSINSMGRNWKPRRIRTASCEELLRQRSRVRGSPDLPKQRTQRQKKHQENQTRWAPSSWK